MIVKREIIVKQCDSQIFGGRNDFFPGSYGRERSCVNRNPQANLSRAIRHLNGVYTQAYNRRHHRRVGHLFQGRFTSILIEKEAYLLELCRYVVLNPVRAGMVKYPKAWAWSSYRATAGEETAPEWLAVDWLLGQLGKQRSRAQSTYRQFVSKGIKQQERPWSDLSGQVYLGSEAFLKNVQDRLTGKEDTEIPEIQKRPARPDIEGLLKRVAKGYGKSVEEVAQPTRRPSEARRVAIYCARRVAGLELRAIAKLFGMGYPGVWFTVAGLWVAVRIAYSSPPIFAIEPSSQKYPQKVMPIHHRSIYLLRVIFCDTKSQEVGFIWWRLLRRRVTIN